MKLELKNIPIIKNSIFTMRPVEIKDASDIFDYGKNYEVTKWLSWGPLKQLKEAEWAVSNVFLNRPQNGLPYSYAIVFNENEKMIGTVDFVKFDIEAKMAEIGYVLHQDYWGKGIMPKAVQELIKVGFDFYSLERIQIRHHKSNFKSRRVIEKCGFKFEGVQRKGLKFKEDGFIDIPMYSITNDEYFSNKLPWQKDNQVYDLNLDNMTIKDIQNYIKNIDYKPLYKTEYALKLMEEVGELANCIRKDSIKNISDEMFYDKVDIKGSLEEELYDVLHMIFAIANIYDIDMEKAIILKNELNKKKYNR